MTSSSAIPCFHAIADLYAAAGIQRVPDAADFDVLRLDSATTGHAGTPEMGPHRRGFFQFTYIASEAGDGDVLLAAAPDQVLANGAYLHPAFDGSRGYTVLCKASVLTCQLASPTNEFPFFHQPASLELPGSAATRERLLPQLLALEATSGACQSQPPPRDKRGSSVCAERNKKAGSRDWLPARKTTRAGGVDSPAYSSSRRPISIMRMCSRVPSEATNAAT